MDTLSFEKYPSIENSYKVNYFERQQLLYPNIMDMEFYAQEKIDGSNFSVWIQDRYVTGYAKRSGFINGGSFFNYENVIEPYKKSFTTIYDSAKNNGFVEDGDILVIFCELFGQGIQRRIDYGGKDLMVFDVAVHRENGFTFFGIDTSEKIMGSQSDLKMVPVLATGKLSYLFGMGGDIDSAIANDKAEGIVIKPVDPELVDTNYNRIAFKQKSEKFTDKEAKKKSAPKPIELDPETNKHVQYIQEYLTENRVLDMISKIGDIGQKQFQMLMGKVLQDAIHEYESDFDLTLRKELEDGQYKKAQKVLTGYASEIVRPVFVKHL